MLRPAKTTASTLWDGLSPTLKARFDSLAANCDPEVQLAWKRSVVRPLKLFLRRPSKEFRANLTRWGWSLGRTGDPPESLLMLVELIHAGSLIMDDVQDESDRRRGGKAVHCAVGVPLALNAAVSLYFLPFQMLSNLGLPESVELRLHRLLSDAMLDCCHGQSLDLSAPVNEIPAASLRSFVETATMWKTGRLMGMAAELGAVAAEVDEAKTRAACDLAASLGVSLQMLNDLCELAPCDEAPPRHEDLLARRPTWAWVWAHEQLGSSRYSELLEDVRELETENDATVEFAGRLHDMVVERARCEINERLESAMNRWANEFGDGPELQAVLDEARRLERAYAK